MSFTSAQSLTEALDALSRGARAVAGGSDLVVGARHGKAPLPESLVAIDRIVELSDVTTTDRGITIGATVNHATLVTHRDIVNSWSALADASALVGSPATRNVGTLGGNIMNASPAMDTGAPLVVLEATVTLQSLAGSRDVAIADLWTGPGSTVAATDELCTAVHIPRQQPLSGSAYVRLEYRRAMEIAVVGAAAAVTLDAHGNVAVASVALTAVAATITSVRGCNSLIGLSPTAAAKVVAGLASAQATPISDVRASANYRRHCVGVMASRALLAAAARASGEAVAVPVNRSGVAS